MRNLILTKDSLIIRPCRPIFRAGVMLLLFLALGIVSMTDAAETARKDSDSDSAAIRDVTREMWIALGNHDLEAFLTSCSDDWQLYTATGKKFSAERLLDVHRENIRNFRLEATNMQLNIVGDLAWGTYEATMSAERQGEPWSEKFLMTHIYERRDNGWVCVHTHESRKS